MPRARNIKPGFFKNDELSEIPPFGRLLFIGLWTIADRSGRLENRPKGIKGNLFPHDEIDVVSLLAALHKHGFIQLYTVDRIKYIQICKFDVHQNPHMNEDDSEIPAPTPRRKNRKKLSTRVVPECSDTTPADSYNLIPDSLNTISPAKAAPCSASDLKKNTASKSKKLSSADEKKEEFETAWKAYPRRPGASKKEAWQAWLARRRDGVDAALMVDGVRRYAAYIIASGQAPKFVKHAATFFGPYEHYKADWSVPEHHAPPASSTHTGFANTNYAQGIAQDGSF
ncbi:hypothetical protein ACO0LF_28120 [Undibacterium sp. Di27W]|uniref:hypothetical protein n=1 Tax=Undibacterium sp. Di27W TaxID=3413036 RepID=UPI003BF383B6